VSVAPTCAHCVIDGASEPIAPSCAHGVDFLTAKEHGFVLKRFPLLS